MTGPKPGSRLGCIVVDGPRPGELWLLQDLDFWTAGALNGWTGDFSDDACILPGGVIRWPWAEARAGERMGEELGGSAVDNSEGFGILQAGVDVERELLGELECCGTSCVLGSENETRMASPDRCRCTGVKRLAVGRGCCIRPPALLACISSASARTTFMSTLQRSYVRKGIRRLGKVLLRKRLGLPWSDIRSVSRLLVIS